MVKFFLTIFIITTFAYSDILNVVKTFVDPPTFRSKQNLIKVLFANPNKFTNPQTGKFDTIKITQTLKNNGLLSLSFHSAQTLNLVFQTNSYPLLSMRIINDALEELGYTYYVTKSIKKDGTSLDWSININTQNIVDPMMLSKKLKKRNCSIQSIRKRGAFGWVYKLSTTSSTLKTIPISLGVEKGLGRPNRAYWLRTNGGKSLKITSHPNDNWFPHVTFFNPGLTPIDETNLEQRKKALYLKIPPRAAYVRIEDKFLLDNIKRGLKVRIDP